MKKLRSPTGLVACALLLLLLGSGHAAAKGWRRIVPLRSTRAEVERRLGKPRGGFYEVKGERAFIFYSNGRGCDGLQDWDVPRDTVVRIVVRPRGKLWLSSLRLDPRKFEKSADPGMTSRVRYTDRKAGLTYEVSEGEGAEDGRVMNISFEPAAEDEEGRRCPGTS